MGIGMIPEKNTLFPLGIRGQFPGSALCMAVPAGAWLAAAVAVAGTEAAATVFFPSLLC